MSKYKKEIRSFMKKGWKIQQIIEKLIFIRGEATLGTKEYANIQKHLNAAIKIQKQQPAKKISDYFPDVQEMRMRKLYRKQ